MRRARAGRAARAAPREIPRHRLSSGEGTRLVISRSKRPTILSPWETYECAEPFCCSLPVRPRSAPRPPRRRTFSIRVMSRMRGDSMPRSFRSSAERRRGPRAAYVESIGRRVGAMSGVANPGQALHFTTLNSAVENAMSVPGGFVYITRQLMTIMDDESQLAFALGHEVGHIAANHAHIRQQYAQRNPWGVFGQIVGAIFGGAGIGNIISQQAALQTLSFSRDQEYQADSLAIRYLTAAGYDPAGGPGILAALSRASALQSRVQGRTNRQAPEWASTPPAERESIAKGVCRGARDWPSGYGHAQPRYILV